MAFACQINAQETKLVTPTEDKSQSTGANEAKIIFHSNSETLSMTHSMGTETGVKKALADGTFEYTINYSFPEDYEDDFMKTQLVLRMAGGQETVPLTFAGMERCGRVPALKTLRHIRFRMALQLCIEGD